MAINVFQESILTLSQARNKLPQLRPGKQIHVSTLYRWMLRGLVRGDGTRVRLETIKIGGTVCTSKEALQRFFERLETDKEIVEPPTITARMQAVAQNQRVRQAERELRMFGLDGDGRIFEKFQGSKEQLCDLHEHLHKWMPPIHSQVTVRFTPFVVGSFRVQHEFSPGKTMSFTITRERFDGSNHLILQPSMSPSWTALGHITVLYGDH